MRVRHLLVATDLSTAGDHAVGMARLLAGRFGATLATLLVRPAPAAGAARGPGEATPVPSDTLVIEGLPAIEIVRYAEQHAIDLIVLGRSPRRPAPSPSLGDTCDAVIRRANVPCLVVPEGQDRLARLLVALDGSERGMAVMRTASELRRLSGDGVSAIFVETDAVGPTARVAGPGSSTRGLFVQRALREILVGRVSPPLIQRQGDVVTEVLHGLSPVGGDVLAVGVRRGGPAGVSDSTGSGRRLLAAAPCAVLTVPL